MLNQSQEAAASHGSGPCLVVAGPGSGKTTVLTERICYLVNTLHIPEESILVVTFTREAATEMRRRYLWKAKSKETKVTFGTFHSIFFQILKEEANYTTADIISGSKQVGLLEECRRKLGLQAGLAELNEEEKGRLHRLYRQQKDGRHLLDFDDMIRKTGELFHAHPEVLAKWQQRFRYFLVDEMQDMSDGQYEILRLMASPLNNLYMVGDDDQAIYGFRGANPSIMLGFERDYPDAKRIVLHINYRCRPAILTPSMKLIAHNKARFEKEISAAARKTGIVSYQGFSDPMTEAKAVASKVEEFLAADEKETVGILFRNRIQAIFVAEELRVREIAFSFKDSGNRLLNHFITADIRAYFRMALDTVYGEDLLLVANKPNRDIPRWCISGKYIDLGGLAVSMCRDATVCTALRKLQKDVDVLSGLSPFAGLNYLLRGMGYEGYLRELAHKRGVSYEYYSGILEALLDLSKEFRDGTSFLAFLSSEEVEPVAQRNASCCVFLHTFHGAKGLEFDRVMILDANEGVTPSKHVETEEGLEEERRMFYVAMTRAKKELCISAVEKRQNELLYPSRFLKESGIYSSSDASSNI